MALLFASAFAAVLWLVRIVETVCGLDFARFGVIPGSLDGLYGIVFAPLIHGSWSHLASNTVPLIVLGTALLYAYPRASKLVLPILYFGTGFCVWLFARHVTHYGASGLTFGMMFFVFTIGAIRWDRQAIALSMLVFFLYGGMIWGIFPNDPNISFETHFFGASFGVSLAFICRNWDPSAPKKRYSWEEDEESDDPS
jgi:membrane associated rhomboid family serine protease